MATPTDDPPDNPADEPPDRVISRTLRRLAQRYGYQDGGQLVDAPMSDLLPPRWSSIERAAVCDDLIRQYATVIRPENYSAAVIAALNLNGAYNTPTLRKRLVAFRRDWHQEHPTPPPRIDLSDEKQTWEATRKWWDEGRDRLTNSLRREIERRNHTGHWPEPTRQSLERIEAAMADNRREGHQQPAQPRPGWHKRTRKRHFKWLMSILAGVLFVAGAAVWLEHGGLHWIIVTEYEHTKAATCADVGDADRATPDPIWYGPFRAAYEAAGGESELGCPRTDDPSGYVHQWGFGTSQDLQGGMTGIARIMALDPQHVIIMAGSYWHDYTDQGNGQPDSNAAQEKGYPTSNPVPCGPARLVLLEHSQQGEAPGAMVTAAHSKHFIWLPKHIWLVYKATGGPFGRLGQPVGQEHPAPAGIRQSFEHGYIILAGGVASTDLEQAGIPEPANPGALARLGSCIGLTRRLCPRPMSRPKLRALSASGR